MTQPIEQTPYRSPEQPGLTARPTWVRWHVVAILMGYSFMTWFNRVSMEAAGAEIMKAETLTKTQVGTVYSSFFLCYTIFMTPGGWFSDRFGAKAALVWMGFGSALFCACTGFVGLSATSPAMLLGMLWLVRGAMGVFTAPVYPASGRMIAHWLPFASRGWANGLVQGSASVGIASAYVIFSWLIELLGWPASFLVTGAVTAALALCFAVYVTNRPASHRGTNVVEQRFIAGAAGFAADHTSSEQFGDSPHPVAVSPRQIVAAVVAVLREWLDLLRHRSLLFLTLSYTAVGYFEYLFFFWMPNYFKDELHFGETESRFYGTFPPIAMAIGMPLGGWLSDRIARLHGYRLGRVIVPACGMSLATVLLACGIIAANTSASPATIVTLFSLSLGAMGAVEGPIWASAIHLGGRRGSTAAGICNTGGNAGGTLAPTVTPWVGAALGWNYSLALSCVICLAGVVLWFWIDPSRSLDEGSPGDGSTPGLAPSSSA